MRSATPLKQVFADWVRTFHPADPDAGKMELFKGNKWEERSWQAYYEKLLAAILSGSLLVGQEMVIGDVGQILLLIGDEKRREAERVCFIHDKERWRVLASIINFTACPFDYNTQRNRAMMDLNCDYVRWAASQAQGNKGELTLIKTFVEGMQECRIG